MGPISEPMSVEERITALRETCLRKTEPLENRHSILIFDGREHTQRLEIDAQSQLPPSLPDCWLYTTMDFLDITDKATAEDAKDALVQKAAEHADKKSTLDQRLREDKLRLITVSRARFNPRFRGRFFASVNGVRAVLVHAGMCLAEVQPYRAFDFDAEDVYPTVQVPTDRQSPGARSPIVGEAIGAPGLYLF